jgi:hypothetical protein
MYELGKLNSIYEIGLFLRLMFHLVVFFMPVVSKVSVLVVIQLLSCAAMAKVEVALQLGVAKQMAVQVPRQNAVTGLEQAWKQLNQEREGRRWRRIALILGHAFAVPAQAHANVVPGQSLS